MTPRRPLVIAGVALIVVGVLIIGSPAGQDVIQPSWNCGRKQIDRATGGVTSTEVRRCILAAYRQRTRAHSEHVQLTMEGDPIAYTIRVRARDDFELTRDTTKDRYGPGRLARYRCTGMTGNEGGSFPLRLVGCGEGLAFDIP